MPAFKAFNKKCHPMNTWKDQLDLFVCMCEREGERREDNRNKDRLALLFVQGGNFGRDIDKNMGCSRPLELTSYHTCPGSRA
jgi:hypothetical protein